GEKMHSVHEYFYWEFPEYGGQIAIRMGKWKGLARDIKQRDEVRFELYDLMADPMEKINMAGDYPEIIEKFHQIVKKEHLQPEIELFRIQQLGDSIP
ncbi:MAG: N-acetylgalactosamine-6-sulfatase, partial [Bacteroidales bacterium]